MHTNIQSFFCLFWFLCFKDISGPYADFYSAPKQTCFVLSICSFFLSIILAILRILQKLLHKYLLSQHSDVTMAEAMLKYIGSTFSTPQVSSYSILYSNTLYDLHYDILYLINIKTFNNI